MIIGAFSWKFCSVIGVALTSGLEEMPSNDDALEAEPGGEC